MWHRINFQRRKTELILLKVDLLDDKPLTVDFGVDFKYSRSLKKKKQKTITSISIDMVMLNNFIY